MEDNCTDLLVEVDGSRDGLERLGSSVVVGGAEGNRPVVPDAAREAEARPAGAGPVGEGLTGEHADMVGEGVARRGAEDAEQLAEGALAGAGGHERQRRVDGQRRVDEVAAPAGVVGQVLVEAARERLQTAAGGGRMVNLGFREDPSG
jgi:hypothetical protein